MTARDILKQHFQRVTDDDTIKYVVYPDDWVEVAMQEYAEYYAKKCLKIAVQNAEVGFIKYEADDEGEFEVWVKAKRLYGDAYKYTTNFDSLPSMQVYQESITNIPLPPHD